jgi:hypothetical protein
MGIFFAEGAAAAAVGTDLMAANKDQFKGTGRLITGIAYVGSTAAGDAGVDIFVGDVRHITDYKNTTAAQAPTKNADWIAVRIYVPAGELIRAVVTDAGVGNATRVFFNTVP